MKILFKPNKKLGQNFLLDKYYLNEIIKNIDIDDKTLIIEIGSGYGNLTELLEKTACKKIISFEKDKKIFEWLKENKKLKKTKYINIDVLLIDWENFCKKFIEFSIVIVGNLPYYISNFLLIELLFNYKLFKSMVFLVQKEVGKKWNSDIDYSSLSVLINYLSETKLFFEIPRIFFNPRPKVDGILISLIPKNIIISKKETIDFFRFLKNCFRFRRKTLLNNLLNFLQKDKKLIEYYFFKNSYNLKIRPQNLNSQEYWNLFIYFKEFINKAK